MGAEFVEKAPHFDAVMKIMAPLEYSGLDSFFDSDSKLNIDFNNKTWSMNTVYSFNPSGEIVLSKTNSALCRGLAMYTYQKIKPLFDPERFEIKFAKVKESNYFFREDAMHIILIIRDKNNNQEYLLDPSFKRYGNKNALNEYIVMSDQSSDEFMAYNQIPQKFFLVNKATPLFIQNTYIVLFSVQSHDEKFDKNNFILTIAANKPETSVEEYVLLMKCENGNLKVGRNESLATQLLGQKNDVQLSSKLQQWAQDICGK